ncbi:nucleosome assembly protein [Thelonectria olida]|uniref:Nucleosome assembly protein n=1 Tax=Thelonectria olida TaxID=1576542 RepID=A0A9P8W683_9HYPO|nr:nucleosome assembly protein [Thelonectria olida]
MSTTSDLQDANLDEALVTFEKLQDIEDEMDDVEVEILRQQDKLTRDIYKRREEVVAKIPQFWPLVLEQAPMEIDEYIRPSDSEVLLTSLVNLKVERFELPNGDPRSLYFKFEFKENEWFENKVLEKKFYWRRAKDSWAGLVSDPVNIKWKSGKDLTSGMLDLVHKIWEEEKAGKEGETENVKQLKKVMDNTPMDDVSFFAWFGFRGRKISIEEHNEAEKKEEERRAARKAGKKTDDDEMDEDEDDDEDEYELEVFPTADDLAICIAEDLYPGAIKYFTNAQEDDVSDIEFESDEDEEMEDDDKKDAPATKKRKA